MTREISSNELKLRDVVAIGLADSDYASCTVIAITETEVTLFRPYVHTSDFSYVDKDDGNRVIPYVGIEECKMERSDTRKVTLLYRAPVRNLTSTPRVEMRPPRKGERGWWVSASNPQDALAEVLRESEELGWIAKRDYTTERDEHGMRPITVVR